MTWTLRNTSDTGTTVEPMLPPPFMLEPRVVSHDGELTLPPVEPEPLWTPNPNETGHHASKATQRAIERQYSTFERNHQALRRLLISARHQTSSSPIHGPRPDPPARPAQGRWHAPRC